MPTFKKLIIAGGAKKGTALPVFFFADVPMLFHVFQGFRFAFLDFPGFCDFRGFRFAFLDMSTCRHVDMSTCRSIFEAQGLTCGSHLSMVTFKPEP